MSSDAEAVRLAKLAVEVLLAEVDRRPRTASCRECSLGEGYCLHEVAAAVWCVRALDVVDAQDLRTSDFPAALARFQEVLS